MQQRNLLIFFLVAFVLLVGWTQLQRRLWPPPEKKEAPAEVVKPRDDKREEKKGEGALTKLPAQPAVTEDKDLISLGAPAKDSTYHLSVQLDPLGAGVRSVILNKFQQASAGGLPEDEQLALVPADANMYVPAYLLYHFDPDDVKFDHPLDTLGRVKWRVIKHSGTDVTVDHVDGKERQSVSFQTEVQDVTITKTFSLVEGEYHVGLRVDLERAAAPTGTKSRGGRDIKFRYQLVGPRGEPVEGKWYTTTFRNALIGTEDDRGNLYRDLQDLRQVSSWAAGNAVDPKDGQWLRYAGVAVQFFASVIVVDEHQDDQKFLRRAQATLERVVARGRLKGTILVPPDHIVLQSEDGKTQDTIFIPPDLRDDLVGVKDGTTIAAVYRPLTYDAKAKESYKLAEEVHVGDKAAATHSLWEDDITMRVTTDAVEVKPGSKVSHQYLLYNGPVKPSLLGQLTGDKAVAEEVVQRYAHTLKLNTMTDYQSPGAMGTFSRTIGWTWLIITFTNLMHGILGWLHWAVASYGLCIIFLTVMVRGLMFPLSRKQALMGMKMQALAPELKKLQAKLKDDKQALGMAQMELYRKHGVNPFGSCWVLLLQMPVFMGLYYALQESIQFRLAPFWPTWVKNLAAPDMMIWWGEKIPMISRPEDYGGFLYLGPYLNLLPIIAVGFMIVQQKMMMPPPTDEQQEMQQKMMKYMMVFMGLMFYKVAAGLCFYFIATTLWGFTERKLLPKAKLAGTTDDTNKAATDAAVNGEQVSTVEKTSGSLPNGSSGKKAARNKRKAERARTGGAVKEEEPASGLGRLMKRLGDWWTDVLDQAKKK